MDFKKYTEHYPSLIRLGMPIIIGQLGIIMVSFFDTMMVGHHSTDDLGAASFVNNMFNLAIIFSTGFSYGLTPIVGSLFGQKDHPAIGRMLKNSLAVNGVVSVFVIALMGILYLNVERLGLPAELMPLIKPYYLVLLVSLIFIMLFNAFKQFADGITDTKTSMWILLTGNVINVLGNWILIFGHLGAPELGLFGAGIATLISRMSGLAMFAGIFFFSKRYRVYREGFRQSRVNLPDFKKINKMGWPIGLQMGMETSSFSLTAIMVGWLGTVALAAHQIMLTVGQLGFMVYYGMAAAVAVKASNYKGQNDMEKVRNASSAGFQLILVLAAVVSAGIFIFRNQIGGLFTDDAEASMMVAQLTLPFIIYQFGDGLQCNYSNALRGIADVKPLMLYAFIAYFLISLPAGYLFGFVLDWGLTGVWMSFPLGLTSAGLLFYFRFRSKAR